jgi:hypothetical protein
MGRAIFPDRRAGPRQHSLASRIDGLRPRLNIGRIARVTAANFGKSGRFSAKLPTLGWEGWPDARGARKSPSGRVEELVRVRDRTAGREVPPGRHDLPLKNRGATRALSASRSTLPRRIRRSRTQPFYGVRAKHRSSRAASNSILRLMCSPESRDIHKMGNMRVLSVVPRNPASTNHLPPNRKEANESIFVRS